MLKLIVMFGTLVAFIYVLSAIEQSEIKRIENRNSIKEKSIDESVAYPVRKQLEAYNVRDISEFIKWFSDDVKLYRLQSGELFCEGRDNLIALYGDLFSRSDNLNCEVVNRITCGDFVIDEEIVEGIDNVNTLHATAIYEVKDSLIIKAWFISGK